MMKHNRNSLALLAAVAALSSGSVHAQFFTGGLYPAMGPAAYVPYYTVQENWVTGVHIINASEETQVVKFRLRRAEDSKDVLDFNLILSPNDVWTGTVRGDDAAMEVVSDDKSCTAPALIDGTTAPVRAENLAGAQEGYIEILGMGAADADQPISKAALHVNGTPVNCDLVRENFLAANVVAYDQTKQISGASSLYTATEPVLKVSYFIRDNASGIEFGNSAVHWLGYFDDESMMTHQQYGVESYASQGISALNGWDFPDVRGGGNNTGDAGTRENWQIAFMQMAALRILNDWSYNPSTGATTDWTVTFPGQYAMVDVYQLAAADTDPTATWDYRQIPVVATFTVFDREENTGIPGGLDFSPSPAPDAALLPYEVNVVNWGPDADVLDSEFAIRVNPADAGIDSTTGWAYLAVKGTPKKARVAQGVGADVPFAVCDTAGGPGAVNGGVSAANAAFCVDIPAEFPIPMVGFAAWDRTFDDPDKNYGRIVEHGFTGFGIF